MKFFKQNHNNFLKSVTGIRDNYKSDKKQSHLFSKLFYEDINCSFLILFMLLVFVTVILIMAWVPPVSRDELTHHLAVPKLYLHHGSVYEIPNMEFSYYPMNLDLLYLIPLFFHNDILPKYIHFVFALLTAGFIYSYLKQYAGRDLGLLGALFFLSTPVIVKLSITAYVDLGLVFFSWLCMYFFLKWHANEFKTRYLIFAGISCGLALGTKYNGLLTLFIMGALTPVIYSRTLNKLTPGLSPIECNRNSFKGLIYGGLFIFMAIIIYSPWLIRNYVWTKNPIYPLYQTVFNEKYDDKNDYDVENYSQLNHFQMRRYIYHESFWESVLMPLRIFFQGKDDQPKYFDGKLNPFLLILPIFAFFKIKGSNRALNSNKKILLCFTFLFLTIALFTTDMRIRYISPIIPPLTVLSMLGVKTWRDAISNMSSGKHFFRILMIITISFAFYLNGKYVARTFMIVDPMNYILKKVDRDTYISRIVGEYPVLQYANQYLPQNAKVFCLLIGKRTYYLDREFYINEDFFRKNSAGLYSEKTLMKRLTKSGVTHIILGLSTYQNWIKDTLNKEQQKVFKNFFKANTKIIYQHNGYQLLEVIHGQQ
jgi:hypothetical protein